MKMEISYILGRSAIIDTKSFDARWTEFGPGRSPAYCGSAKIEFNQGEATAS